MNESGEIVCPEILRARESKESLARKYIKIETRRDRRSDSHQEIKRRSRSRSRSPKIHRSRSRSPKIHRNRF